MNATSSNPAPQPTAGAARSLMLDIPVSPGGQTRRIELLLDSGHVYYVISETAAIRNVVIELLVYRESAAVVQADGGLIGDLKVWENLVLPAAYHTDARILELEERARGLFAEFGISGARFEQLCTSLPHELNRYERRLCAFVRTMLTEPQIVIYDSLFDGLTREETGKVLYFDRRFHDRFPLGTSLHLSADLPTLPDLGAQRTFHL